jgi:hypothetical protein
MEDVVDDERKAPRPPGGKVTSNPYPPRSKLKKLCVDASVKQGAGSGSERGNRGCITEVPRFSSFCEVEEGECIAVTKDPSR